MELYFKLFFQGFPFVAVASYLFATKRNIKNMVFFYCVFPFILYLLSIAFIFETQILDFGDITINIFIVNTVFAFWICCMFFDSYNEKVFEYIVRKKFKKIASSKKYEHIRLDKQVFLNSIEETKEKLWYFPKYILTYVDDIISEMFVEDKIFKDVDSFLGNQLNDKKIENEDMPSAFHYLFNRTISYVKKNEIAFELEFSNIPQNVYETFFKEYLEIYCKK